MDEREFRAQSKLLDQREEELKNTGKELSNMETALVDSSIKAANWLEEVQSLAEGVPGIQADLVNLENIFQETRLANERDFEEAKNVYNDERKKIANAREELNASYKKPQSKEEGK